MATVKVSVKAFEGQERENAYISATRPSIKILSTLFTIKLLILSAETPKISKKVGIYCQKLPFLAINPYFFGNLGSRNIKSQVE